MFGETCLWAACVLERLLRCLLCSQHYIPFSVLQETKQQLDEKDLSLQQLLGASVAEQESLQKKFQVLLAAVMLMLIMLLQLCITVKLNFAWM